MGLLLLFDLMGGACFDCLSSSPLQVPTRVSDQMQRLLGSSDAPLDKMLEVVRIINVQCLIRSFLARRRVAKIKKEANEGPSEFQLVGCLNPKP